MKNKSIASPLVLLLISLYLLAPLAATFLYSLFSEWKELLPRHFTTEFYRDLFRNPDFLPMIGRSLLLSVISVSVCMVLLLMALYAVVVHFPRLEKYLQFLCMLPYTIQGIILATSLLTLYAGAPGLLSERVFLLLGAYCIIILPYMYQGMRNSLRAVPVLQILESAEILGCGKVKGFFLIIVPNILSGITVSVLLSIGIVFGDFAIINILASSYVQTLQIFMSKSSVQSGHTTSAIVIIAFAVMSVFSVVMLKSKRRHQTVIERV